MAPPVLPQLDALPVFFGPTYEARLEPNLIAMDDDESIANIFCLEHLLTEIMELYTMTSQANSHLCPSMAVSVSPSSTTMSQMPSSSLPFQD